MDCSLPGFSVHGILQARILEWVAIPSPRYLSDPGIAYTSLALAGGFFVTEPWLRIALFKIIRGGTKKISYGRKTLGQ